MLNGGIYIGPLSIHLLLLDISLSDKSVSICKPHVLLCKLEEEASILCASMGELISCLRKLPVAHSMICKEEAMIRAVERIRW